MLCPPDEFSSHPYLIKDGELTVYLVVGEEVHIKTPDLLQKAGAWASTSPGKMEGKIRTVVLPAGLAEMLYRKSD